MSICRCGHDIKSEEQHPCHGLAYACKKPATSRFVTYPVCVAGGQPKLGAYETWACDECWEQFKKEKEQ